ncbi:MAG: class I SAM-dependent methyltransferase [Anaerolineaceae bacterium]|nr:class I SAM-dependent methyltransferase [Anaerolineaceae bacterium]
MQNINLKNNLRETYDKYAQDRESTVMQDWKLDERASFLSTLQKEHKHKLLEIGAGTGRDSKFFQDQGFEVTCIDLSPAMIDLCSQKGLNALVMDMTKIDLPDQSFDAVYSMNSLLHLAKDEFSEVLLRINSLLRPDGIFYLGMYGGYDFAGVWENDAYTPNRFFSFFTDEHLKEETSKVFEIVSFNRVVFESDNPSHFQSVMLRNRLSAK